MRDEMAAPTGRAAGLIFLFFLAGCGRANIMTEIRPDGSWTRKIVLKAPSPPKADPKAPPGLAAGGMDIGPKLEDVFGYPTAAPWKVTKQIVKDEQVITAE